MVYNVIKVLLPGKKGGLVMTNFEAISLMLCFGTFILALLAYLKN